MASERNPHAHNGFRSSLVPAAGDFAAAGAAAGAAAFSPPLFRRRRAPRAIAAPSSDRLDATSADADEKYVRPGDVQV